MIIQNGTRVKIKNGDDYAARVYQGDELIWYRLPDAYQEVEWIQSNGGRIETEVYESFQSDTKLLVIITADASNTAYISSRTGRRANVRLYGTNEIRINYDKNDGSATFLRLGNYTIGSKTYISYGFDLNGGIVYGKVNDGAVRSESYRPPDGAIPTDNMRLLALSNNSSSYYMGVGIARYEYSDENNSYVYIPCYEKTTGNIGMYDIINGKFIAGSGALLKGPDVI